MNKEQNTRRALTGLIYLVIGVVLLALALCSTPDAYGCDPDQIEDEVRDRMEDVRDDIRDEVVDEAIELLEDEL